MAMAGVGEFLATLIILEKKENPGMSDSMLGLITCVSVFQWKYPTCWGPKAEGQIQRAIGPNSIHPSHV
jgi:hypothetical protein